MKVDQPETGVHFSRAGTELAQALVRFLRIEVAALRQRTLPFLRLLLQNGRIGLLLRIDQTGARRARPRQRQGR